MTTPLNSRSSGILLHPTSLPGPFSQGDIGPSARKFIDFLEASGQSWWQMLPIHPVGGCDSPYDSPSAFAGSDLLISLEDLASMGLLERDDLRALPRPADPRLSDFNNGRKRNVPLLKKAHLAYLQDPKNLKGAYEEFLSLNETWVWDYALFTAVRKSQEMRSWVHWAPELRARETPALEAAHQEHSDEVLFQVFCQFLFHYQWGKLREYARDHHIKLMGDIPMFVSHDSADVWSNQKMFHLNERGHRTVQAGVPPDYFCEDGQLWGNPLYRWDTMKLDGYGWWIDRLRRELDKFDTVRLDHFIAFSRYWEVPMGVETAREGNYRSVPGHDFFAHVRTALGSLPFVAEDLGTVTREVEELRDAFELPGMKVLQFAFAEGAQSYLPHSHPEVSIAYLGTHDNDTTRGWYEGLLQFAAKDDERSKSAQQELTKVRGYAGVSRTSDVNPQLIRALQCSPARTVILTIQDILDESSEFRMNVPGVAGGNWQYRFTAGQLTQDIANELRNVTLATDRGPRF